MRLCVNLILVVLNATGPTVCCCTATTVFREPLGPAQQTAGRLTKHAPHYCCPAHGGKATKAGGKSGGRPVAKASEHPSQSPEQRSCPCQEQRQVPTAALDGEGDARLNPGSRDFQSPPVLDAVSVLGPGRLFHGLAATAPFEPRLPFMSRDERLRAHHALRC